MQTLFSLTLIFGVSFAGEALSRLLPLPVPGSIYGLVILLILLMTKVVKLEKIRATGDFLLSLMPLMFIAPSVGLMTSYEDWRAFLVPLIVILPVSTLIVMGVTGRIAQRILRRKEAHK